MDENQLEDLLALPPSPEAFGRICREIGPDGADDDGTLSMLAERLAAWPPDVYRLAPPEWTAAVLASRPCPAIRLANNLDVQSAGGRLDEEDLRRLVAEPWFPTLTGLDLGSSPLFDRGVEILLDGAGPGLRTLFLQCCQIRDDGAAALARSNRLTRLRALGLHENRITSTGAKALAASTTLGSLDYLVLSMNSVDVDGAAALLSTTSLPLATLSLHAQLPPYEKRKWAGALKAVAITPTLRGLDLGFNTLGYHGARALAQNPSVRALEVLSLRKCGLSAKSGLVLAESPHFESLRELKLEQNVFGKETARAIAKALPQVRIDFDPADRAEPDPSELLVNLLRLMIG